MPSLPRLPSKFFFALKYTRLEKASVIQKLLKITTRASIPLTLEGKSWVSAQSPLCHGQRRAFFLFLNKSFCSMQLTNCPSVARQEEKEEAHGGQKIVLLQGWKFANLFLQRADGIFFFYFFFFLDSSSSRFFRLVLFC